jgi:stage V sporulation protein SpoVS
MAKKIIILTKENKSGYFEIQYLFWLTVPVSQQPLRVSATVTSSYRDASTAEIQAIQVGQIAEVSGMVGYTQGTSNATVTADLISRYNSAQVNLNTESQWHYYGTYWDGTSWTLQGVN